MLFKALELNYLKTLQYDFFFKTLLWNGLQEHTHKMQGEKTGRYHWFKAI